VSPDEKKDTPTSGDSYNGPIGELRLGVRISPVSIADVAYLYSFRDSVFSNYVTFHRIGLSYEQRIAERVEVKLLTAYSYLTYAQAPRGILYNPNQGHVAEITTGYERVDGVLDAGLSVSVDIARYLAFEFTYKVSWLNDLVNEGGNFGIRYSDGSVDYVGFTRHVAMGTVVVRY
jgi:hypothetical protein